MDTRLATRQFKLKQWAGIITDCRNSGLKVDDYLREHDITRDRYYYWLRAVRRAALEQSEIQNSFVEITRNPAIQQDVSFVPQLTVSVNGLLIGVNESTPSVLLTRTLEAVSHVK